MHNSNETGFGWRLQDINLEGCGLRVFIIIFLFINPQTRRDLFTTTPKLIIFPTIDYLVTVVPTIQYSHFPLYKKLIVLNYHQKYMLTIL